MVDNYKEFLQTKQSKFVNAGFTVDINYINKTLFEWQRCIVKWALIKGKCAIFAECGLGKTFMQLEYAQQVHRHNGGKILIIAPLAVSLQTKREAQKLGYDINICKTQADVKDGINITNYERIESFDANEFAGVVLDESSILKGLSGKTRQLLTEMFELSPYKLCCTATPSPNDFMELGNHSEFLGIMSRTEMLATYFVHDGGDTAKWRLKGHAESEFWKWISTWAVVLETPADIGFDVDGYILPQLNIITHIVESVVDHNDDDQLCLVKSEAKTLNERREARKDSINERVNKAYELVDGITLVWCDYNNESELLSKTIPCAVEVKGSDKPEHKENTAIAFANGEIKSLVSKSSIFGFGLNFQKCHNMIFCGLSDSYESFYQAVRRCWRFGQKQEVNVHVIISEREMSVLDNIKRKEKEAERMRKEMIKLTRDSVINEINNTTRIVDEYKADTLVDIPAWIGQANDTTLCKRQNITDNYALYNGDSVEILPAIKSDSIHYSVFSPPFSSLYTYSNSDRDLGNSKNDAEFMKHFNFIVSELYRVIMPGRLVSFHCMNLPTSKERDGYIGIRDFRGELIRLFESHGFIYHSEVCIWKDPVIAMQRTKALGLLHKQIKKDSAMCRQGIPDYLVTMRKPGINEEPITHTNDTFPVNIWQHYASPIWTDINPSDTLQYRSAREHNDERHICIAEGTLVLTKRGYIPIENVVPYEDETITHTGAWKKIIAKELTGENADVVQVVAQGVPNLNVTPEHKLYTTKSKVKNKHSYSLIGEPEWIEAKNALNMYVNIKLPPIIETNISEQEIWIIGRWLADGHVDVRGKQYFVSVGNDKYEMFCKEANGYIGHVTKHDNCNCFQVGLVGLSETTRNILKKCGKGALNKVVPYELISLNAEMSKMLIDGYISGDGHTDKIGRIHMSSVSRSLLLGMAIIAQRAYGSTNAIYSGRVKREKVIQGRNVNCNQEWISVMCLNGGYSHAKTNEHGTWKRVKSIRKSEKCNVWNIQVEDDASFTAEGCIVKNCPLQLTVIKRSINLWTNPNDIVLTPFMGIASEVYQALLMGRRGIGIELKNSYYNQAVLNCEAAMRELSQEQINIFDVVNL